MCHSESTSSFPRVASTSTRAASTFVSMFHFVCMSLERHIDTIVDAGRLGGVRYITIRISDAVH